MNQGIRSLKEEFFTSVPSSVRSSQVQITCSIELLILISCRVDSVSIPRQRLFPMTSRSVKKCLYGTKVLIQEIRKNEVNILAELIDHPGLPFRGTLWICEAVYSRTCHRCHVSGCHFSGNWHIRAKYSANGIDCTATVASVISVDRLGRLAIEIRDDEQNRFVDRG